MKIVKNDGNFENKECPVMRVTIFVFAGCSGNGSPMLKRSSFGAEEAKERNKSRRQLRRQWRETRGEKSRERFDWKGRTNPARLTTTQGANAGH